MESVASKLLVRQRQKGSDRMCSGRVGRFKDEAIGVIALTSHCGAGGNGSSIAADSNSVLCIE